MERGIYIKDGKVYIRIWLNGQRHMEVIGSESTENKQNALLRIATLKDRARLGKLGIAQKEKPLSFKEGAEIFWPLWLGKKSRTKGASSTTYGRLFGLLVPAFGSKILTQITHYDVLEYRKTREKLVSPSTVNLEQGILSAVFNSLIRAKEMGYKKLQGVELPVKNPCQFVPKADEKPFKRTRVLNLTELSALKSSCDPQLWGLCKMAVYSTLRKKDLFKLVTEGKIDGKTQSGVQAKTGRPFQFTSFISEVSEQTRLTDKALVNWRRRWSKAKKAAGLQDLQWRDLRRTGATLLAEKGYQTQLIKGILGHASEKMTEKYIDLPEENHIAASRDLASTLEAL